MIDAEDLRQHEKKFLDHLKQRCEKKKSLEKNLASNSPSIVHKRNKS